VRIFKIEPAGLQWWVRGFLFWRPARPGPDGWSNPRLDSSSRDVAGWMGYEHRDGEVIGRNRMDGKSVI